MRKCCYPFDFAREANNKITIQQKTNPISDLGVESLSWSTLAQVQAIVTPMKQYERLNYSKLDSQVTHKIIIKYRSDFANPLQAVIFRILFKNRILEITQAINIDEADDFIHIMANEVQS